MKKKLAIISAKDQQEPLVLKAKEMGIETHCFAWDKKEEDTYCKDIADYFHPISILDKEKILEKCKELRIDGVTTILNDYAIPTIAYVAQNMGLIGNHYNDMLIALNKYKARQAYQNNRVNSPRFALVKGEQMPDLSGFKYPLIVKPTDRNSSLGVKKIEKKEDLANAIKRAQEISYSNEAIIEEYVSGVEVCVLSISWEGKHYHLEIQDKITTGSPFYVEVGHRHPAELSAEMQQKVKDETSKALTALNFRYGATDNELMITETGEVFIIEVNPRMGGDFTHELVQLSTGYDFLKGTIDVALNQFEEPKFPIRKYAGIYYLSKDTEWVKQVIKNKDSDPDIVATEIIYKEMGDTQSSFDRYGHFIYQSDRNRKWGP